MLAWKYILETTRNNVIVNCTKEKKIYMHVFVDFQKQLPFGRIVSKFINLYENWCRVYFVHRRVPWHARGACLFGKGIGVL